MSDAPKNRIGDYELLDFIGGGGEGLINKARCVADNNPKVARGEIVAIKRMRSQGQDEKSAELFQRQIEILRALAHPNILQYRDSFSWQGDELGGEVFCLVTEYLEGEDLKTLLEKYPAGLPWEQLQHIFGQTLEALVYAQTLSVGIVHRDLKPSNIFITRDGIVKLLDFGIARRDDGVSTNTASAAGLKGSFDFMAPDFVLLQEFRGDIQSDVFSLGVCLYQMLTGSLPFPPLTENAVIGYVRRWHDPKTPEVEFKHQAFKILGHAKTCVTRSLSLQREQRYKSFQELQEDFKRISRYKVRHGPETYEYLSVLGHGGFGRVYKARRQSDGSEVAVKCLIGIQHADRFKKEAQILKEADNRFIVNYIDFVEVVRRDEDTQYFLILEYLEGMPAAGLRARINASGSGLEVKEALQLFINYLLGLEHLHKGGIIHRDIKPGNLYAPEGYPERAKIFDLGISLDLDGTKTRGQIPGTMDYMPPEFSKSGTERGSPQSDVYSIGVALYETLTRELPLPKLSRNELVAWDQYLSRSKNPPPYHFDHPIFRYYPKLVDILNRALAPNPRHRYRSAQTFCDDLQAVLEVRCRADTAPVSAIAEKTASKTAGTVTTQIRPPIETQLGVPGQVLRVPDETRGTLPVVDNTKLLAQQVKAAEKAHRGWLKYAALILGLALCGGGVYWGWPVVRRFLEMSALEKSRVFVKQQEDPAPMAFSFEEWRREVDTALKWLGRAPVYGSTWRTQTNQLDNIIRQMPGIFSNAFNRALDGKEHVLAKQLHAKWVTASPCAHIWGPEYDQIKTFMSIELGRIEARAMVSALDQRIHKLRQPWAKSDLDVAEKIAAEIEGKGKEALDEVTASQLSQLRQILVAGVTNYLDAELISHQAAATNEIGRFIHQCPMLGAWVPVHLQQVNSKLQILVTLEMTRLTREKHALEIQDLLHKVHTAKTPESLLKCYDDVIQMVDNKHTTSEEKTELDNAMSESLSFLVTNMINMASNAFSVMIANPSLDRKQLDKGETLRDEIQNIVKKIGAKYLLPTSNREVQSLEGISRRASEVYVQLVNAEKARNEEYAKQQKKVEELSQTIRRFTSEVSAMSCSTLSNMFSELGKKSLADAPVWNLVKMERLRLGGAASEHIREMVAQREPISTRSHRLQELQRLLDSNSARYMLGENMPKLLLAVQEAERDEKASRVIWRLDDLRTRVDSQGCTDLANSLVTASELRLANSDVWSLRSVIAAKTNYYARLFARLRTLIQKAEGVEAGEKQLQELEHILGGDAIKQLDKTDLEDLNQGLRVVRAAIRDRARHASILMVVKQLEEQSAKIVMQDLDGLDVIITNVFGISQVNVGIWADAAVQTARSNLVQTISSRMRVMIANAEAQRDAAQLQKLAKLLESPSASSVVGPDRETIKQKLLMAISSVAKEAYLQQVASLHSLVATQDCSGLAATLNTIAQLGSASGQNKVLTEPEVVAARTNLLHSVGNRLGELIEQQEPLVGRRLRLQALENLLQQPMGKQLQDADKLLATLRKAPFILRVINKSGQRIEIRCDGEKAGDLAVDNRKDIPIRLAQKEAQAIFLGGAGYVPQTAIIPLEYGEFREIRVPPFDSSNIVCRIVYAEAPASEPKINLRYGKKGEAIKLLLSNSVALPPGIIHEFVFERMDYQPISKDLTLKTGDATQVVKGPALSEWKPTKAKCYLDQARSGKDLDKLFEDHPPATVLFAWDVHGAEYKRRFEQWREENGNRARALLVKGDDEVAEFRCFLFQYEDPAVKALRRSEVNKMPKLGFKLPPRIASILGSLDAKHQRLSAWMQAATELANDSARERLASTLRNLSQSLKTLSPNEAHLCALEAALLQWDPTSGRPPDGTFNSLAEFSHVSAHAGFREDIMSWQDSLRKLDDALAAGCILNRWDGRLAIYCANLILDHCLTQVKEALKRGYIVRGGVKIYDPAVVKASAFDDFRATAQEAVNRTRKIMDKMNASTGKLLAHDLTQEDYQIVAQVVKDWPFFKGQLDTKVLDNETGEYLTGLMGKN